MPRSAGILLPVTSLPSRCGIGTLGREAFAFAEFLHAAGQRYWQVLPLGPTGYGDSPYQSFSSFAGNPYLIDLDLLIADGLLTQEETDEVFWGRDPRLVDYGAVYEGRFPLLRRAYERGCRRDEGRVAAFMHENEDWLPDYALFMALKARFGMRPWIEWPREIRLRAPEATAQYKSALAGDISFYIYLQYLFFAQWAALRAHCETLGVRLIGDLPIYVALDSADVWSRPENYLLDGENLPVCVAGVPPDYFCDDGQLWGNPIYDWARMRQTGFAWWMRRIGAAASLYDMLRIDHFRGLSSYWAVPYGETTARRGEWEEGPGRPFIDALKQNFPDFPIIAEDLGDLSDDVFELMAYAGYPGMRVLQFGFDAPSECAHQPHAYPVRCVSYTGTHDNDTTLGWLHNGDPEAVGFAAEYLGLNAAEGPVNGMLRGGMASAAELFVAPMQDYLGLDSSARMNTPSTKSGNWRFRLLPGEASPALARRIARMTRIYGRKG